MPSAYAYLAVTAPDLPLAEITSGLGIEPTESWSRGDPGDYNPARPDSGWCLASPLPRSEHDLGAHIEALLSLLRGRQGPIQDLSNRFTTRMVCVGTYDESCSPGLFIARESVALLASLGVAIDVDLYF